LATAYLQLGQLREAEEFATRALETDVSNPRTYSVLADIFEQKQEFKSSISYFEQYLERQRILSILIVSK
jgi:Tfp pilus assembly protein PilF